jgi:Bardet-Biedl syndrome 5 protein
MELSAADMALWQDCEVRIDARVRDVALRRGERVLCSQGSMEDAKGAGGERGTLSATNLRLLWVSHRTSRANMSIGWGCCGVGGAGGSGLTVKTATSRLRGPLQALVVSATFRGTKFEFIFTSAVRAQPAIFSAAQSVLRCGLRCGEGQGVRVAGVDWRGVN